MRPAARAARRPCGSPGSATARERTEGVGGTCGEGCARRSAHDDGRCSRI
jgi:hypothetical protein